MFRERVVTVQRAGEILREVGKKHKIWGLREHEQNAFRKTRINIGESNALVLDSREQWRDLIIRWGENQWEYRGVIFGSRGLRHHSRHLNTQVRRANTTCRCEDNSSPMKLKSDSNLQILFFKIYTLIIW